MSMQLTILGSSPAWPAAGRACSGYLLRAGGSSLLIDCGTGVFERLRVLVPPEQVPAIIISHLHFDHWVDLIPFRYYLRHEAPETGAPPQLHLSPGALATMQRVVAPIDADPTFFSGTFGIAEYDPLGEHAIGGLSIRFHTTRHPIQTYAMRLQLGDTSLVYSADSGWDPELAEFARGTDLFLCEAAWAGAEGSSDVHLSGAQAGRLAALAGAKKLVLTHLLESQAEDALRAARAEYGGPVAYAAEGEELTV
jgi:ribonuclease BN (tRNA processing enzyme)